MTLNWLDITLLVLLAAFVAQGIAQGFTRVAVGLASTVLGILLAAWFYGVAGAFFQPFVSSKAVANIIGFVVIFVGVQLAGALVAWGLSKLFRWSGLSWLDRTLGGVFGALKAALVAIALVMVLTAFPGHACPTRWRVRSSLPMWRRRRRYSPMPPPMSSKPASGRRTPA